MSDPTRDQLPRRFPTWPGVLAALAVAGALAGAQSAGVLPPAFTGPAGHVMIAAHALVALAAVTLLGEAASLARRGRELAACQNEPDDRREGWPVTALDNALSRLYVRHSTAELRSEVVKTADRILERQQWTWRLGQGVCFLVPAVGFAAALWLLRKEGNTVPWRESGLPLMLSLAEALPVVLLVAGVRGAARSLVQDWRLFAEGLAVERRPAGEIPNPSDFGGADDGFEPEPPRRGPAPAADRRRPPDDDDYPTAAAAAPPREPDRPTARRPAAAERPAAGPGPGARRPPEDDPDTHVPPPRKPTTSRPAEPTRPPAQERTERPATTPPPRETKKPEPKPDPKSDRKVDESERWY